ncbi:MAG: sugar ABC transporter ATP-binding protein [Pseudonocardiaceae bacterium]
MDPILRLRRVTKLFPGVIAVEDVDLDVLPGEVHVLAGENGAGKSTLCKLLTQVEQPSSGSIEMDGAPVAARGPGHARRLGIAMVYQELALAPHLSVAENLLLGDEPGRAGYVSRRAQTRTARELLARVGLDVPPERLVQRLPVAAQQRVELARALAIDAKVLILDEPTASLSEREAEELFTLVGELVAAGIAVLYISHRLDEIFRIGHRVTVLRDGRVITTRPVSELDTDELIRLMVGRDVGNLYPRVDREIGEVVLRVEGISSGDAVRDVSFVVHAGEILGLAGLVGAGRTELARTVFGANPLDAGRVLLDGATLRVDSPNAAIRAGIGYLTENRKGDGLALQLGVDQNITLANLPVKRGLLSLAAERRIAARRAEQLNIRTPSLHRSVGVLSGGNQQKVVVARWLEAGSRVLFFDEPGRGVDVGAKAEMFELIGRLAAAGRAIVLISSYLPELLNMCDRIVVMHQGSATGMLHREEFSEERIMELATGACG